MLASITAMLLIAAQTGCTRTHDPDPAFRVTICPLKLPPIRTLSIDQNGDHGQSLAGTKCTFRLNPTLVRRYLKRGGTVTGSEVDGALLNSPCKASGTITFTNGRKAKWSIESLGVGSIALGTGELIFTYCPNCGWPFEEG